MHEPCTHDGLLHVGVGPLQLEGEQGIRRPGTVPGARANVRICFFTLRPPARARRRAASVSASRAIAIIVFHELAIRGEIHVKSLHHRSAMGAGSAGVSGKTGGERE